MDGVLEASFTSLVRRLYINFMAAKYISYGISNIRISLTKIKASQLLLYHNTN